MGPRYITSDHPGDQQFFGFLSSDINSSSVIRGSMIDELVLYYQPTESNLLASIFFLVRLAFICLGEFLNVKIFLLMSKETCLVQDVVRVFAATQIAFLPTMLILNTGTDIFHPLNEIVGQWFCTIAWFLTHVFGTIIVFNSLVVAAMRYCFIVHEDKVKLYEKKKVQNLFFWMSIGIPLFMIIWEATNGSEIDLISTINKCYGKDHKKFLIDKAGSDKFQNNICDYTVAGEVDTFSKIIATLRRVSCITNKVVLILMTLNITEGILYYKTMSHINR